MGVATKSPARLWVLLAREAPVGVIFRRGPSKQVLLIKWDTRQDRFEYGQWLKSRVYERRSDLSPNGKLLIYFAANQKPPLYSWTAISKPPYFTALALWPKGDCWNGGGWFVTDRKVRLNHDESEAQLHSGLRLGPLKIVGYAESAGEDATVWDVLLERDGWKQSNVDKSKSLRLTKGWSFNPPMQWTKRHPRKKGVALEMSITGIGLRNAPWYQINYRVVTADVIHVDLGLADWADWDHAGDLVFAKGGMLFRQRLSSSFSDAALQIADFNELKFEQVAARADATRW